MMRPLHHGWAAHPPSAPPPNPAKGIANQQRPAQTHCCCFCRYLSRLSSRTGSALAFAFAFAVALFTIHYSLFTILSNLPSITLKHMPINSPRQVLLASLIGTTIEFFDFYIYATAAVLVFPQIFFPSKDPSVAMLASLITFGIAFVARPVGSALFGHFGDRVGRKTTLVVALLTMGISTVAIGALPTYDSIGLAAPILLGVLRFGQGLGLGGEWGGAVLLAVENAPPGKRAWYGMFPQLGAPIGYFFSGGIFLTLSHTMSNAQFLSWGWRLPFLASSALVLIGLYVRFTITETPVFQSAVARKEQVNVPFFSVFSTHAGTVIAGVLVCLTTFTLFYLLTVFTLGYGTSHGFSRETFLIMQLACLPAFALGIPISAVLAKYGRRLMMVCTTLAIAGFGIVFGPLFRQGAIGATIMLALGLSLMGMTYGALGTIVSELFPTSVRYTGSSLTFSLAGIFGASLAPSIAAELAKTYGIQSVGYYLSASAVLTLVGLAMIRETKDDDLTTIIEAP